MTVVCSSSRGMDGSDLSNWLRLDRLNICRPLTLSALPGSVTRDADLVGFCIPAASTFCEEFEGTLTVWVIGCFSLINW